MHSKKWLALSISLLLVLPGCGDQKNPSSSAPLSEESFGTDLNGLIEALHYIGGTRIYDLSLANGGYLASSSKYYVSTPADGGNATAVASLPYFEEGKEGEYAFEVKKPESSPKLSRLINDYDLDESAYVPVSYEDNYPLSSFSSLTAEDFTPLSDGGFETTNQSVMQSFGALLDLTSAIKAGYYTGLVFFPEGGSVIASFSRVSGGKRTYQSESSLFYRFGTARVEAMEQFVSSFSWDKYPAIGEDAIAPLMADLFHVEGSIYLRQEGMLIDQLLATFDFKSDGSILSRTVVVDPSSATPKTSATFLKADEEGKMHLYGVNGQNEPMDETTRYYLDDYHFLKEFLKPEEFRKNEDGTYTYLGYRPQDVYHYSTYLSISDDEVEFQEINLTLKDEVASSLTMKTNKDSAGNAFTAKLDVAPFGDAPEIPTSYEPIEEVKTPMEEAFAYFDGAKDHPFQAVVENAVGTLAYQTTYTFDGTTYLVQNTYKDASGNMVYYDSGLYGYSNGADGLISLQGNILSGALRRSKPDTAGETVASYLPQTFSPAVFKRSGTGQYTFRENVIDVSNSFFFFGIVDPSSVLISLDSKNRISLITYELDYSLYPAYRIRFSYEDVSLPNDYDIAKVGPYTELASYQEDSPKQWENLLHYLDYNETLALKIPYLYDERFVGGWQVNGHNAEGRIPTDPENDPIVRINLDTQGNPATGYSARQVSNSLFIQPLLDSGFTTEDNLTFLWNDADGPALQVTLSDGEPYGIGSTMFAGIDIVPLGKHKLNTSGTFYA